MSETFSHNGHVMYDFRTTVESDRTMSALELAKKEMSKLARTLKLAVDANSYKVVDVKRSGTAKTSLFTIRIYNVA